MQNQSQGKSKSEIEGLVKDAAIQKFKSAYEKKAVHPYRINDGVLHGGVVWKGLGCVFNSVGTANTLSVAVEVDISDVFSGSLSRVEVDFHIYAGKS